MLCFKSSVSIIRNGHRLLSFRGIHNSSVLAAGRVPKSRKSPAIRGSTRLKASDPEKALPPFVLLQSGYKSGVVPIEPAKSLNILRRYQELAQKPNKGWEQRLLTGQ